MVQTSMKVKLEDLKIGDILEYTSISKSPRFNKVRTLVLCISEAHLITNWDAKPNWGGVPHVEFIGVILTSAYPDNQFWVKGLKRWFELDRYWTKVS